MPALFGTALSRHDIERRVGDMRQLAGITAATLDDGRGRGMRVLHVHTGSGLEFTVLPDRALDILDMRHNGRSLAWQSGVDAAAPALYDPRGLEWLRSFSGGMLTTCGLGNVGSPNVDEGLEYGQHGRVANTPAGGVAWSAGWEGEEYVLRIRGTVRESRVFGPRLLLHRTITARLGSNAVDIADTVENDGFSPEPFMLLYHVNCGYPLVDDGARVVIESERKPFDSFAREEAEEWDRITPPRHGMPEQVFIHTPAADGDGYGEARLLNDRLGLGFRVRFRTRELPYLWQWKMMGERDYVLGLEPCNCGPGGRHAAREAGLVPTLPPRGSVEHRVTLEALAG